MTLRSIAVTAAETKIAKRVRRAPPTLFHCDQRREFRGIRDRRLLASRDPAMRREARVLAPNPVRRSPYRAKFSAAVFHGRIRAFERSRSHPTKQTETSPSTA